MKKFYTDNKLAKLILPKLYNTITIGLVVISKKKELTNNIRNHESIHIQQYLEIALFTFVGMFILASIELLPWWCTILSLLSYYAIYGLEWLIRCILILCIGIDKFTNCLSDTIFDIAYDNMSFEKEASTNENNNVYLVDRHWFAWIKYIKLGKTNK